MEDNQHFWIDDHTDKDLENDRFTYKSRNPSALDLKIMNNMGK